MKGFAVGVDCDALVLEGHVRARNDRVGVGIANGFLQGIPGHVLAHAEKILAAALTPTLKS